MSAQTTKSLDEWRQVIAKEVPFIDIKPYSHNIIGLALSAIAKNYGKYEANQTIEDFELDKKGWNKV